MPDAACDACAAAAADEAAAAAPWTSFADGYGADARADAAQADVRGPSGPVAWDASLFILQVNECKISTLKR